MIDIMYMY